MTGAGSVSGPTMSRMIRSYACINAQDPSSTYTSCVWRIGLPITSPKGRINIASFTHTRRLIANCASIIFPMSSSMRAGHTLFSTSRLSNLPMPSSSTARSKMVVRNSTSTSFISAGTRKSSLTVITLHKSSWRTSASVVHIAPWNADTECCC